MCALGSMSIWGVLRLGRAVRRGRSGRTPAVGRPWADEGGPGLGASWRPAVRAECLPAPKRVSLLKGPMGGPGPPARRVIHVVFVFFLLVLLLACPRRWPGES